MTNNYSDDIEEILNNIRINCVLYHKAHKKNYLVLKEHLKYYKIPIIIISSISSIISLSQDYVGQRTITILNMSFGLLCSIIGSIELFFGISNQMINELAVSKDYEILALDIYKCLTMRPENRNTDGKTFLEQCFGTYIKLVEKSSLLKIKIEDKLLTIPQNLQKSFLSSNKTDYTQLHTPRPSINESNNSNSNTRRNSQNSIIMQSPPLSLSIFSNIKMPKKIPEKEVEIENSIKKTSIIDKLQNKRTSFYSISDTPENSNKFTNTSNFASVLCPTPNTLNSSNKQIDPYFLKDSQNCDISDTKNVIYDKSHTSEV